MKYRFISLVVLGSLLVQGFEWETLSPWHSGDEEGVELRRHQQEGAERQRLARKAQDEAQEQIMKARREDQKRLEAQEQAHRDELHYQQQDRASIDVQHRGRWQQRTQLSEHAIESQYQYLNRQRGHDTLRPVARNAQDAEAAGSNADITNRRTVTERVTTLDGPQDVSGSNTLRLRNNNKKKNIQKPAQQVIIYGNAWGPQGAGMPAHPGIIITNPNQAAPSGTASPKSDPNSSDARAEDDFTAITP